LTLQLCYYGELRFHIYRLNVFSQMRAWYRVTTCISEDLAFFEEKNEKKWKKMKKNEKKWKKMKKNEKKLPPQNTFLFPSFLLSSTTHPNWIDIITLITMHLYPSLKSAFKVSFKTKKTINYLLGKLLPANYSLRFSQITLVTRNIFPISQNVPEITSTWCMFNIKPILVRYCRPLFNSFHKNSFHSPFLSIPLAKAHYSPLC
jgi:hypothetical protein